MTTNLGAGFIMDFRLLDRIEKYGVAAAYALLAFRMIAAYRSNGNLAQLVYVIDGSVIVLFLLTRRPAQSISTRPMDWFAGIAATFLSLLVAPPDPGVAILPGKLAALLMLAGTAMHLAAKIRLWRSFGIVAANRGVVDKGVYGLVRHPMYLGYIMVQLGLLLAGPNPTNLILIVFTWLLFIVRVNAEERILDVDPRYRDFMARTRYRLIPGIY